jgi:hypothetical protein
MAIIMGRLITPLDPPPVSSAIRRLAIKCLESVSIRGVTAPFRANVQRVTDMAGEKLTKRVLDTLKAREPSKVGVKVRKSFVCLGLHSAATGP